MALDLDEIKLTFMPDGLPHFKLPDNYSSSHVLATIRDGNDLLKLAYVRPMLCRDAILTIKYISAQRMDREINCFQPFSLKAFCNIINSLKFSYVYVRCPHSDVLPALLDNVIVDDGHTFYKNAIHDMTNYHHGLTVVFPDAGAEKRFNNMDLGLDPKLHSVVTCGKHRDMQTGKLSHFYVANGNPKGACLIVDDLVDGGRTFTGIAKVLREYCSSVTTVSLAAYHAILSAGFPIAGIDKLYCTNSYNHGQVSQDIIVIPQ